MFAIKIKEGGIIVTATLFTGLLDFVEEKMEDISPLSCSAGTSCSHMIPGHVLS